MSYNFTTDWFSARANIWASLFGTVRHQPLQVLEIGCFEGRSAVWMLENILLHPNSHITCVDPFTGSDEHSEEQKNGLYERFAGNVIANFPGKVTCIRDCSSRVLKNPDMQDKQFDIIYIDGDHHAWSALEDAVLAFPLLMPGGFMVFDDFLGGKERLLQHDSPYPGIHAFLTVYAPKIRIVYADYQIFIQKISN